MKIDKDGWTKKSKGNAKIYTHPDAFEGRAIVENSWGVRFNGATYPTVQNAKDVALKTD